MILSKIGTFYGLSKTLLKVLNRNEKNNFFSYLVLSVLNTFLELVSISVIILMLFMISGQNISNSSFNVLFELIPSLSMSVFIDFLISR